ncbi:MAG: NAD(P)/FAD-dependent oxidoreductase [Desulfovibrio sp.]|jgi:2,4-dienoyl-CoA reductase-like NADH-dependent reductase (Old Yellow Enzyme family)/thioredoxin reductase|nr:NAD(P)/FAD-dependent oxidoreductase [Desulfovibrio sp.]
MLLSEAFAVRDVVFKNRAVLAPMVPNCAEENGRVSRDYRDFYLARARGGVGLIVLGGVFVHPDGRGFGRQLGIHDDATVPGLSHLVETLGRHCRTAVQISFKSVGKPPEMFRPDEIAGYAEAFVHAARRAEKCGFDAIELHACHDYWLNCFLSPHFNHRDDEYGGSPDNRFRLLGKVAASIRESIGGKTLLGVRLSIADFVNDGLGLEESLDICSRLEKLGVDYISASGGIGVTQYRMSPPMEIDRGSLLYLARAVKDRVSIPVVGVGRLDRPQVYRDAAENGDADLIAAARAYIADPEYARKTMNGDDASIRPCLACNYCLLRLHRQEPVACCVNPFVGQDMLALPRMEPRRVVVVGGGVAGMNCASLAARSGAQVTLLEAGEFLGGTLHLAKKPPYKGVLQDLLTCLERQVAEAHVQVRRRCPADVETVAAHKPDLVVLATGATPIRLLIEGLETHPHVLGAEDLLTADVPADGRYLVVGGGLVGLECAEYIMENAPAAKIALIEAMDAVGKDLHATRLNRMLRRMRDAGVAVHTGTGLAKVDGKAVYVKKRGEISEFGAFDHILVAVGYRSHVPADIKEHFNAVVIGDSKTPGGIHEALRDGLGFVVNLPHSG